MVFTGALAADGHATTTSDDTVGATVPSTYGNLAPPSSSRMRSSTRSRRHILDHDPAAGGTATGTPEAGVPAS